MEDNNNNKRKLDGRKSNKRKDRIKIIKSDNLPAPKANRAKKNRAKQLSKKAITNIFRGEDGIWEHLAGMALEGNIKAMEMLLQYQYGKAGDAKEQRAAPKAAPVIQFNVAPKNEPTIDITPDEDE